jgi:hypothetical protein
VAKRRSRASFLETPSVDQSIPCISWASPLRSSYLTHLTWDAANSATRAGVGARRLGRLWCVAKREGVAQRLRKCSRPGFSGPSTPWFRLLITRGKLALSPSSSRSPPSLSARGIGASVWLTGSVVTVGATLATGAILSSSGYYKMRPELATAKSHCKSRRSREKCD